jgi:hypothetical protein
VQVNYPASTVRIQYAALEGAIMHLAFRTNTADLPLRNDAR